MFVFFHVWYFDIFQGVWIFGVWYYGMSRSQTDKVTRLDKNMPKTKCLDCARLRNGNSALSNR